MTTPWFSSPSQTIPPAGTEFVAQAIPDSEEPATIAKQWGNFAGVDWAGGDFVTSVAGVNGQLMTVLSSSPLTTGESFVVNTNQGVLQPCALEFAGSFVRTGISFATASLFANDPVAGPDPVPAPINIVSYYQSNAVQGAANSNVAGTVLHMLLASALPAVGANNAVFVGDWINIVGLLDSRFNYANACINYISPDRLTIAVGFSDETALPSILSPAGAGAVTTVSPPGSAQVTFYNNMSGARNGVGLRLTTLTPTQGVVVSIFGGDDNQVSGSLFADHRVTIANSNPIYVAGANWGQYEIRATSRYRLESAADTAAMLDKADQSYINWVARDIPRTSVKPASGALLYPRFRLFKPASMSRPIAKIVSAVKASATTTATINTDVPHGLVTGNYVTIKGIRDQTNFANFTVPAAVTVLSPTQFTVVCGIAAIATAYGGSVILANGNRDQPGIIAQVVQSVQSRVAAGSNWLDVGGNGSWSGFNPGDYVNLHGVRDSSTGADLGLDGAWEVAHLATSTMTLRPVFNISGVRVSPALGTLGLTNCGGTVIVRPTLRAHDFMVQAWAEARMSIDGQGTNRIDKMLPCNVLNSVTVLTQENTYLAPTPYALTTAATTNAAAVKTSAGTLYNVALSNTSGTTIFVKFYNKASAPTVGTDVPIMTIPVAAGAFFVGDFGKSGKRFSLGIALAVTGLQPTADTTAVSAGSLLSLDYI